MREKAVFHLSQAMELLFWLLMKQGAEECERDATKRRVQRHLQQARIYRRATA